MRDTWYVLEDGSVVDPKEVSPDDKGALRHTSGVAVAMRGDVPSTRGVDTDEENAKGRSKPKEMKPAEGKKPYNTRETKSKQERTDHEG